MANAMTQTPVSPEYETALAEYRTACDAYRPVRDAYRAGTVTDDVFTVAQSVLRQAIEDCCEADNAEALNYPDGY